MRKLIATMVIGCYVCPAILGNMLFLLTFALPLRVIANLIEWSREVARGGDETYYEVWQDNWDNSLAAYLVDNITNPLW